MNHSRGRKLDITSDLPLAITDVAHGNSIGSDLIWKSERNTIHDSGISTRVCLS